MPKDYSLKAAPPNEMRRPEYACDDAWIAGFLIRAQIGHIATLWDEQPFITPTLFWYDPERNLIYFHSNIAGRIRANLERQSRVCFEACQAGKFLPSNLALEFSMQYESVVAFGRVQILDDEEEASRALYGLIEKYFPGMTPGKDFRPIAAQELARTSVYAITIDNWSGKRNWKEQAKQSGEWAPLDEKWLASLVH